MSRERIVELEPGVWLASGEGDPPRTLDKSNARIFRNYNSANCALEYAIARYGREFKHAYIRQLRPDSWDLGK